MVVKVYISGISGNKEVKKRQQRVVLILDSKNVKYEIIDIAEPGNEQQKDFMQSNSTSSGSTIGDPNPRHPLPPQIFNEDVYCGDYDGFDNANEIDEMDKFLHLAPRESTPSVTSNSEIKLGNGEVHPEEREEAEEESKEDAKNEVVEENGEDKNEDPVEEKDNPSDEKENPSEDKENDEAAGDN